MLTAAFDFLVLSLKPKILCKRCLFLGQGHISRQLGPLYVPSPWHIDQPSRASNQPWLWTTLCLVFLVGLSVVRKPVQELFLHPVSLLLVFHHAAPQGQGRCELGGDLWGAPGLKKVSDETGDKQDRTKPGTRKEAKPREVHTAPQTN